MMKLSSMTPIATALALTVSGGVSAASTELLAKPLAVTPVNEREGSCGGMKMDSREGMDKENSGGAVNRVEQASNKDANPSPADARTQEGKNAGARLKEGKCGKAMTKGMKEGKCGEGKCGAHKHHMMSNAVQAEPVK